MSSSRHRAGYQTAIFFAAASLPLGFSLWMLGTNEVSLWSGSMLVIASMVSLVIGLVFVLSTHQKVAMLLREQGQQNRRLQETQLEQERLGHELNQLVRSRRELRQLKNDQNRAVLQVAREFEQIAGEVKSNTEKTDIDELIKAKLSFLNDICGDLVELLNLEINETTPTDTPFVVDQEVTSLVSTMQANKELPEKFKLECEDSEISAHSDRSLFMETLRRCLVSLIPFSYSKPIKASMISYMHGDLDEVVQFTVTASGHSINDLDSDQWFSHFQLHTDRQGYYLGPGLSMMIVKRYADRLGGLVTVSAEVKHRITLTLTLPLRLNREEDEQE